MKHQSLRKKIQILRAINGQTAYRERDDRIYELAQKGHSRKSLVQIYDISLPRICQIIAQVRRRKQLEQEIQAELAQLQQQKEGQYD